MAKKKGSSLRRSKKDKKKEQQEQKEKEVEEPLTPVKLLHPGAVNFPSVSDVSSEEEVIKVIN